MTAPEEPRVRGRLSASGLPAPAPLHGVWRPSYRVAGPNPPPPRGREQARRPTHVITAGAPSPVYWHRRRTCHSWVIPSPPSSPLPSFSWPAGYLGGRVVGAAKETNPRGGQTEGKRGWKGPWRPFRRVPSRPSLPPASGLCPRRVSQVLGCTPFSLHPSSRPGPASGGSAIPPPSLPLPALLKQGNSGRSASLSLQ